ncbi:hypothetical protein DM02DRAFT_614600 [Periconia macrospinosa]|uniref:Uncharacterized protein n=1 Tax=Periconia macrospinosa TaxID=97972 RepID=A0A2V1DSA7_9PLEO|nr:hypothetical protein DM02DRAFT_614600 [Periconia macrospinosa]
MSVDWNLAAVVVAIVALSLTPIGLVLFRKVVSILLSKLRPSLGLCEKLEWSDLVDGILHTCTLPEQNCAHHETISIMEFFSWKKDRRLVKKPGQLYLTTSYLRTDTKTLRGFLSLLHREELGLMFEEVGTVMTASVTLDLASKSEYNRHYDPQYRIQVSKKEMDLLFQGYPPWYQDPLSLANRGQVPHPIQGSRDIFRGGWIVAVGLSRTLPISFEFLGPKKAGEAPEYAFRALERITHRLKNLSQLFGGRRIELATELVDDARSYVQESAAPSSLWMYFERSAFTGGFGSRWHQDTRREFAQTLTNNDCILAMQIFNQYEDLSESQKLSLEPILTLVLRAMLVGVYQVATEFHEYKKWERRKDQLPPELLTDRSVYLYRELRSHND